jgi:hypothetical protein
MRKGRLLATPSPGLPHQGKGVRIEYDYDDNYPYEVERGRSTFDV